MPSLLEIAQRTGTDKAGHGYLEEYLKWFPPTCRRLLEIGCERGRSAMMWSEYFGNEELDLHLIDLFVNKEFVSPRWCRNRGFVPWVGDQSDINFLYSIKESFQICIDDGSHRADHQLISFKHLFLNNLRSGSIYAIEDTHCNRLEFYWGTVMRFEDTPLHLFKTFLETGKIDNPFFEGHEAATFEKIIDKVEICADDKLILLWRK